MAVVPITKSTTMKKPKGKCFKCGQKGHWKKDCTMLKQKPSIGDLNIVEACLVENYNQKWIIDSGATNHICYSLQWFKQSSLFSKRQKSLTLGNEEHVSVMAIGLIELSFDKNKTLILEDCLLVSDFKRNLVYVSCLIKHGLTVQFNSPVSIRNKYSFICFGTLLNGLYFLSLMSYDINPTESINDNEQDHLSKKRRISNKMNETYLWHL